MRTEQTPTKKSVGEMRLAGQPGGTVIPKVAAGTWSWPGFWVVLLQSFGAWCC